MLDFNHSSKLNHRIKISKLLRVTQNLWKMFIYRKITTNSITKLTKSFVDKDGCEDYNRHLQNLIIRQARIPL